VGADTDTQTEKRVAAEAAAELVEDGMTVGLGTGSTVAFLLPALVGLDLRCVATSVETEELGRELGLAVEPFDALVKLDIAIDGADQVAPDGWLVKGGGGAHTREKIVAATAQRFVVIGDSSKPTDKLAPPVPLELFEFGFLATIERLGEIGDVRRRDAQASPDGGVIADYFGEVGDPAELSTRLAVEPGVVDHGLFPASMVSDVLIGRGDEVERLTIA
jgi:ribose 5-phosphate isomerase A